MMLLQQFYLKCLAHASYIVGDERSKQAVVIDPQRDIEQYLAYASEHGLTIGHVVLTHLHADFLAGHLELRDRVGARIYLGAKATAEYAFTPLAEGDEINLGQVRLRALSTPGHTPESISLVVFDDATNRDVPAGVLTGDTLFVGDVGRPDLRVALGWSAADLGSMLYDSLHDKLMTLPDSSAVYPAHGAGSLCGKAISKETVSTIGEQRKSNYALQPMSKDEFVAMVTTDQPDAPAYFTYDAVLNTKERPTLDEALAREVQPIPLDAVLALREAGAQLLDTREPGEFAAAHLAGSINVGLSGQYATWVGTVLRHDKPVVIVAAPGTERESATRLGRIGFDQVVGYLQNGLASLSERPDLTRTTERLGPDVAAKRVLEGAVMLDVRAPNERFDKRIKGSLAIPLTQLEARAGEVPRDRPVIVHCAGGYRSSIAASLLARAGVEDVSELAGGIAAWEQAKLPIEGAAT
jgi:glyoxylase-like metal-dependent hydrolase (beta-lactamase superfamily II)/rhodanese-related sulfurtransferase